MSAMIEARSVSKRFGKVQALHNVDLALAEGGGVLALLGPNGAGKTTFVRAVATLIRPDGGTLHVAGMDVTRAPDRVRSVIGLAGQAAAVEAAMTGRENIELIGRLVGMDRAAARAVARDLLERFSLTDAADRLAKTYSGGMRRRLDLAASLVGHPRLLLLDEPTTGIDPVSRVELWSAVRDLVAQGTHVLLTTHYLEEADQLANEVAIINHGTVVASGTPAALKQRAGHDVVEVHVQDPADLPRAAAALAPVGRETQVDEPLRRIAVPVDAGTGALRQAVRVLDEAAIALDDIGLRRPTLDEVFLALTGAPAEPAAEAQAAGAGD